MENFLNNYISLIKEKITFWPSSNGSLMYLDWLIDEVQEVRNEIKDQNHIYLQDELWDILWDYLNLLSYLEKEGKIKSVEEVLSWSFEKFSERINNLKTDISRNETKEKQKQRLKNEHEGFYQTN